MARPSTSVTPSTPMARPGASVTPSTPMARSTYLSLGLPAGAPFVKFGDFEYDSACNIKLDLVGAGWADE
eukprot:2834031-Alexandrium_andersonii.AAC.1